MFMFIVLLLLGVIKRIQNMLTKNLWRTQKRLPDELIEEILLRLPEESLMRFKSVSRAWNTRINSASFVGSYGDCMYSSKKVMIFTGEQEPPMYSFSINCREDKETLESIPHNFGSRWPDDYKVLGSCDGLLFVYVGSPYGLWIWNPTTRQYRILPLSIDDSESSLCNPPYGFGCANSSKERNYKDYKVVRGCEKGKFQIFTTCTNSWKTRENVPYGLRGDSFALVNEKLHFFGTKLNIVGEDITDQGNVLLAFDIENEEFRELPEPNYEDEDGKCLTVGSELNKKLCISLTNNSWTKTSIWVMKEYSVRDSWTNMFCIDITEMVYLGGGCYSVWPLHFYLDGKILLRACYDNISTDIEEVESEQDNSNNLLVYYDSTNHKVRIPKLEGVPIRYDVANYVETFLSPDSI